MKENKIAIEPFFGLSATLNNGVSFDFENLRGKKTLIVNSASACGYTGQYAELQQLYGQKSSVLQILAFPSNDFGQQEQLNDAGILTFCKINYGVTFPIMKKCIVKVEPGQHQVFAWLTDASRNGWNTKAPTWNFCKYLLDEKGNLTHFFEAGISPLQKEITEAIG